MKILALLSCGIVFAGVYLSAPQTDLDKSIKRGKELYNETCITCHLGNGEGNAMFPPLAKADYLIKTPEKAIAAVKFGLKGPIKVNGKNFNMMMPNPGLSDAEVADVMNYIRNAFGNADKKIVTEKMVADIKQ